MGAFQSPYKTASLSLTNSIETTPLDVLIKKSNGIQRQCITRATRGCKQLIKPLYGARRWSRPYADEVPEGVEQDASEDGTGPLKEEDLPPTSFVERLSKGGEETAFSGVNSPIVDVVAKRIEARELQYLVLTATDETFWLSRAALTPEFGTLI
ncbi:hypothetical protein GQ600_22697 [Phytophthora cactorum]|nr:hypothetical protein GQ600_22697 [Phytophthora cactorum]